MFIFASLCGLVFHRLFLRSIKREGHLLDYIIYLVLFDAIRNKHKLELEQCVKQCEMNADQLHRHIHKVLESMSEVLAKGDPSQPMTSSFVGARGLI
jgi:hypothetical protein